MAITFDKRVAKTNWTKLHKMKTQLTTFDNKLGFEGKQITVK